MSRGARWVAGLLAMVVVAGGLVWLLTELGVHQVLAVAVAVIVVSSLSSKSYARHALTRLRKH